MSSELPPELTSRQLQTVLAVAEYESFIAAAAYLKTSQPAVTRTLKHVEEVLGVRLFDRSTRSVQITAAGKEFVGVAGRILNDLKITLASIRDIAEQRRGQVIVASIMSVANGKLPGIIAGFRQDFPRIELHVRDNVHGSVIEDVRSGAADFGISYLGDLPDAFVSKAVGKEDFVAVLPKEHPYAERTTLTLKDFAGVPLVSLPSDSRTRRLIDGAASAAGVELNHVVTVAQFATMLGFVRAGVGMAIAPRSGVTGHLGRELRAVPLKGRTLTRELGIITLKQRDPSPAAAGLMAFVRERWTATEA